MISFVRMNNSWSIESNYRLFVIEVKKIMMRMACSKHEIIEQLVNISFDFMHFSNHPKKERRIEGEVWTNCFTMALDGK